MNAHDTSHAEAADAQRRTLELGLGVPFRSGNALEVLRNGDEIFAAMLAAIDAAQRSIDLCTFVYWTGSVAERFAERLAARASEGLQVRVLLDGVGSLKMPERLTRQMREAGADVRIFRPPATLRLWRVDHRTHRKLLVCDNRVGFTGGVGIAEEWEGDARHPGEWRDTHLRLEGPAVDGLCAAFLSNWMETAPSATPPPTPREHEHAGTSEVLVLASTAAVAWSDVALLYHLLISSAESRLRITTPYFVPDANSLELLCAAARRKVDVEILVAGEHNDSRLSQWAGRQHYQALLDAGVRLSHYERTMMHAKVITIDEHLAVLGSPNFNRRSMQKDDELSLVIDDAEICATLDQHFDEDLQHAVLVDPARWPERALWERCAERCAGLFASEV
ncbi:MAG: cardiolipin synthase B [Planctomycetota bacterium]|nr:MAG: cardiolipin synthase B [Planctomycetota bacterium]